MNRGVPSLMLNGMWQCTFAYYAQYLMLIKFANKPADAMTEQDCIITFDVGFDKLQ